MFYSKTHVVFTLVLQFLQFISAGTSNPLICKASLGSSDWPSLSQWAALNASVSGRLLQPPPPGAVCHPDQPTYNATECPTVLTDWYSIPFHMDNPISSAWNNWNNDSCLPTLPSPCSGEGYPVYVINATCKEDVKAGIDFARKNNVRLNVKSSGHDYMGRSTSPNSLSIWTHHLTGHSISKYFTPKGCNFSIDVPAITAGGGSGMGDLNQAAADEGLYILSGGAISVSVGGYLTGGGHSALSSTFGMAADAVLEFEIVSPSGEFLTLNECQNQDLFWATRGGGGSTFGIITTVTIRAWPSFTFLSLDLGITTPSSSPSFYPALSSFLSQFPYLSSLGITSYNTITTNTSANGTSSFLGNFMLPVLSPLNTSLSLSSALLPILNNLSSTYPDVFIFASNVTEYPTFHAWWLENNGPYYAGQELVIGSRLLSGSALSDSSAIETALKGVLSVPEIQLNFYLLGGKGIRNAIPRGGSDAVNPAWRKAIVHAVTGTSWNPLNTFEKDIAIPYLTNTTLQYLRDLDPESGAYVNEADPWEPDWQHAFWGANYERLRRIKREVDPGDVFLCWPCVGNEGWERRGDRVCRVQRGLRR